MHTGGRVVAHRVAVEGGLRLQARCMCCSVRCRVGNVTGPPLMCRRSKPRQGAPGAGMHGHARAGAQGKGRESSYTGSGWGLDVPMLL